MKSLFRVIPFAICVGLTLGFCGCSNDNQTNSSEASSTPATYFDGSETHPIEASSVLSALSSGAMDIQYESEDDTLKTITVNLGMSSDSLKELLPEDAVSRSENESYIHFSTGMARIYFTNDDSPNSSETLLGFPQPSLPNKP